MRGSEINPFSAARNWLHWPVTRQWAQAKKETPLSSEPLFLGLHCPVERQILLYKRDKNRVGTQDTDFLCYVQGVQGGVQSNKNDYGLGNQGLGKAERARAI